MKGRLSFKLEIVFFLRNIKLGAMIQKFCGEAYKWWPPPTPGDGLPVVKSPAAARWNGDKWNVGWIKLNEGSKRCGAWAGRNVTKTFVWKIYEMQRENL